MSMSNTEKTVKDIRRKTRRKHSTEEKIRIVLDGLRGEMSIAELCRREGSNSNLYYRWSKDFLEAGKKRLAGDTVREANTDEVTGLSGTVNSVIARLPIHGKTLRSSRDITFFACIALQARLLPPCHSRAIASKVSSA